MDRSAGSDGAGSAVGRRGASPHRSAPLPEASSATSIKLVEETDGYTTAVAGIEIETVRTGSGVGPNIVLSTSGDGFIATAVKAGFPMLGRTTMGDQQVVAAVIKAAPPGANWCGIDLEPGTVVCYGSAAEHTAVNPTEIEFAFATTTRGQLAARADRLGVPFLAPPRGQVLALSPTRGSRALGRTLSSIVEAAAAGVDPDGQSEYDLFDAMVAALATTSETGGGGLGRGIDDKHVVHACMEYVEASGKIPSMSELCLVAHTSERRLRMAFVATYGMPPARFFRLWAFDQARRHLVDAEPTRETVTRIAVGLGFAHSGRFAGRYRDLYGELPSQTLARQP